MMVSRRRIRLLVDLAVISLFGILASFSSMLLAAQPAFGNGPPDRNAALPGTIIAPLVSIGLTSILMALAPRVCQLPVPLRLVLALSVSSIGALIGLWFLWP